MKFSFLTGCFLFLLSIFAVNANAQVDASNQPINQRARDEEPQPKGVKEMLWKQRAEKEKKEHAELLERGEEILEISSQLETSYEKHNSLTNEDKTKLQSLEKLVIKVRKSLGGSSDGTDRVEEKQSERVVDVVTMIKSLKSETESLVSELKKSTRFTVSALAIETSNTVLKVVRFLKISK